MKEQRTKDNNGILFLKKLTCPSWYWKLYHNLHGDRVSIEDFNDIMPESYPYIPAYCCDSHYENHFKMLSLREMRILEPEELKYAEDNEESWRLIYLFDGKKAWKEALDIEATNQ